MRAAEIKLGDEAQKSAIGPGERLQAARIQQGLSLDDVANRMHLSLDILKAIEDNKFEVITAPIFVKGYLRAYARIVSLNEDEIILQYRDFYSEEDPPISSTSNILPELSAGDVRIKWTTYLVILVIAVMLAAWWWNREQSSEAPISLDSQSTKQRTTADAEVISNEIEAVSEELAATTVVTETEPVQADSAEPAEVEPVVIPESPAPGPAVTEPVAVETEPLTTEADLVETAPEEIVETAPEEIVETAPELVETTPESVETAPEPIETTAAARTGPLLLAPTGSDKLQLVITADTWTDVKDANSYQLIYDLLRAGDSVEMTGEAPFSVFLGNGHGVEIRINGEVVDVSRRIRDDNTARLKVGS